MDPLMESFYPVSPYVYCNNNPIRFIDQDGRSADWYEDSYGNVMWRKGSDLIDGYTNIGETYTQYISDNVSITYLQNTATYLNERVLNNSDFSSQMKADGSGKKAGDAGNCFNQAGNMVSRSGASSLGGDANGITDRQDGIDYINSQIDQGFSTRVQVERSSNGKVNGKHWVAISGRTTDLQTDDVKINFFDPGTRNEDLGRKNAFNIINERLQGTPSYNLKSKYEVIQVRKNKK